MSQELVETGQKYISVLKTNKAYKKGDCVNDLIFIGYVYRKSGIREKWCTKQAWFSLNIREVLRACRKRARRRNVECTITKEYLEKIYPTDSICPVFNTQMGFALGDRNRSASIDRIDPNIGYVPGNVQWISMKANTLKNNAHPYELMRLARFLVKQMENK